VGLVPEPVDLSRRREQDLNEFGLAVDAALDDGVGVAGIAEMTPDDAGDEWVRGHGG
jgi:hypothetical protein